MTTMSRFIEVVARIPHRQDNARRVNEAAHQLSVSADRLAACLKLYAEADDPLAMIMTDIFNQRAMGSNNAERKLHP